MTDSPRPRTYWSVLKNRLKEEGSQLSSNVGQLKSIDGNIITKKVLDTKEKFRLIDSSQKAELLKMC
ncbi:MAG: hypothetical protein PHX04_00080 [Bacilli bacterium]|nr:hypothetical protein [Bacilli bacterium]